MIPDTIELPVGETDTEYCATHSTYLLEGCGRHCTLVPEPDPYWHHHEDVQ